MIVTRQAAINGADILLKKCLGLHRDDIFLLIFDETTQEFPTVFEHAANGSGINYEKQFVSKRLQAEGKIAFSNELLESLDRSRGVLLATTDDEKCSQFRIGLTSKLRGNNALATMPGASLDILSTALDVDYDNIVQMCRGLTVPLIKAKECKITTFDSRNNPHVLTFALGGMDRVPIQSLGIIPIQAWGNVPAGETFVAPLEESANGEYLVNGAIGTEKVTSSREALIVFERGRMVRHFHLDDNEPVEHFAQLKATAANNGHSTCWNIIAEFGIGVNKNIDRIHGVQLIDEKKYGTVHVAIGHNAGYGGATKCSSVHCDMTTINPTVELDGLKFIEQGEHVYQLSQWLDDYRSFAPALGIKWKPTDNYVKLNYDSYHFESDKTLFAKHVTQSGRQTIYAIGNDMTSKLAYLLVHSFDSNRVQTVGRLRACLSIELPELLNLLSLLLANRIIYR